MGAPLFWNRGGRIACAEHAPEPRGEQWSVEGWLEMDADDVEIVRSVVTDADCETCQREQLAAEGDDQ